MQATIEQIDTAKPLIVSTPETAMALFDPVTVGLAKIQEFKSISLEVNGIARVTECRIAAKKARCAVTNRQKELTEGAKKYQNDVIGAAKKIIGQIEPVETYLEGEEAKHQRILDEERKKEEAKKAAILQERCDRLAKAGCAAGNLIALGNMTDELFEWHLKDQAEKAEAARIEREKVEAERRRVAAEEEERRRAEQAERARVAEETRLKQQEQLAAEKERGQKFAAEIMAVVPEPVESVETPSFRPIPPQPQPQPAFPETTVQPGRNKIFFPDPQPISIVDLLTQTETTARANNKEGLANLMRSAKFEIVRLQAAAKKVVQARYHGGDDGWNLLKNAIGELEEIVGRR
jgi:DNA-directed RNA polymerase delta subunit